MKIFRKLFPPKPSIDHPVFGKIILLQGKNGPYWMHESYSDNDPAVTIDTQYQNEPSEAQVKFYKEKSGDLDSLFSLVADQVVPEYEKLLSVEFPSNWREAFEFAGIGVPMNGDANNEWDVTFQVTTENLGYLFNCYFEADKLVQIGVDT